MSRVQLAVFPAILLSIVVIILVTGAISSPAGDLSGSGNLSQQGSQTLLEPDIQQNQPGGPDVIQASPVSDPVPPNSSSPSSAGVGGAQEDQLLVGESTPVPVVEPIFITPTPAVPGAAGPQRSSRALASAARPEGCSLSGAFDPNVLRWCDLIESHATQHGLEPALIAALITQESGGDPNAYSHSGAVGLMQVMPKDGLAAGFMCPAGPCFSSRPSSSELYDPAFNIEYGTRMLAGLVSRYGNIRDALKSYGPINVGYYYADLVMGIFQSSQ